MRIRTVKPEFWTHRMHRRISTESALVAIALLNYADDEGRFEADAELFGASCFPLRKTIRISDAWKELELVGFVKFYTAEHGGERIQFGCLPGFENHQVINRPAKSLLPAPSCALTEDSRNDHGVLTDHSSGKGMERKGKEGKGLAPSSSQTSDSTPPAINSPAFITIPLVGGSGEEHPVTEADIAEYEPLFPAVDVRQTLREMRAWCLASPKKRKTKRGVQAFIVNWLNREQNGGR